MPFIIDPQTYNDLEIKPKSKDVRSVFSYFNYTQSMGGKNLLEELLNFPLTDKNEIDDRLNTIRYFQKYKPKIIIDKNRLNIIEHYLAQSNIPPYYSTINILLGWLKNKLKPRNEYFLRQRGINYLIELIRELDNFSSQTPGEEEPDKIRLFKQNIRNWLIYTPIKAKIKKKKHRNLSPFKLEKYDLFFRRTEDENTRKLLNFIYYVDVYQSLVISMEKNHFSLPIIVDKPNCYHVSCLFHPFLENPVCNDFSIDHNHRICFLTGPNMAGKSTFLKALGLSVYLAHAGFPVPASSLKISIYNGLLTTINLPDNLKNGYSHFYNEILRIKHVAEKINHTGNLFVVFDELFRGTNVKDAFEASLAVINALSKISSGHFAISTHIIEIAEKLKENSAISYKYFEANLVNDTPNYNYQIKDGITQERIGMYLLKKEKVIDIIENKI